MSPPNPLIPRSGTGDPIQIGFSPSKLIVFNGTSSNEVSKRKASLRGEELAYISFKVWKLESLEIKTNMSKVSTGYSGNNTNNRDYPCV